MAISLNSVMSFSSTKFQAKYQDASRYSAGASLPKATQFTPFFAVSGSRMLANEKIVGHCYSVADSDQLAADASSKDFGKAENSAANDQQLTSMNPSNENFQLQGKVNAESGSQTSEGSNGSINQKEGSAASPNSQSTAKRSSLTVRETARVLEALKESDRGKKRSRLPEAPTNMFDDRKRGLPKRGLTFQFPGGFDLLLLHFHLFSSVQ